MFSFLKGVLFLAMPGRERVNVVWFKCTDLRCHDHAALKAAHQGERGMRHVAVVAVLFRKTSTFETTGSERKPDWALHKCTLNYATNCLMVLGSITKLSKARYLCFTSMSLIHFGMLGKLACAAFQRRALFAIVFSSRP